MASVGAVGSTALTPRTAFAAMSNSASRPCKVVALPADGRVRIGRVLGELNETARFIHEHCDGRRSLDDIARAVAAAYEVELVTAHADVLTCLASLRGLGLIR
ncbi:MAG TPA: PqqD family protein [Polyangiaceae bacterium]|nr:PqqD family protein [Polyangiaceae bacterium]